MRPNVWASSSSNQSSIVYLYKNLGDLRSLFQLVRNVLHFPLIFWTVVSLGIQLMFPEFQLPNRKWNIELFWTLTWVPQDPQSAVPAGHSELFIITLLCYLSHCACVFLTVQWDLCFCCFTLTIIGAHILTKRAPSYPVLLFLRAS